MENQIPIGLSHDALLFEEGDATLWVAGMLFRIALDASTPDAPLTPRLDLEAAGTGGRRIREVDIEIVADDM